MATGGAVPPSEALAASAAAGSQLHERPKYVFGQSHAGDVAETAAGGEEGAYSEQYLQTGYDYEAYAHANTPGAEAYGYQDATRGGYQTGAYGDQTGQAHQQEYYYATAGGATAYAAGAGQYYDYSQYAHQQQQGQGQGAGVYGGM